VDLIEKGLGNLKKKIDELLKKKSIDTANQHKSSMGSSTGFSWNMSGPRIQDTVQWGQFPREHSMTCINPKCKHGYVQATQSTEEINQMNQEAKLKYESAMAKWERDGKNSARPRLKTHSQVLGCWCAKMFCVNRQTGEGCECCVDLVRKGFDLDSHNCPVCNCGCAITWPRGQEYNLAFSLLNNKSASKPPPLDAFQKQMQAMRDNASARARMLSVVAGRTQTDANIQQDTDAIFAYSMARDPTMNSDIAQRNALQAAFGSHGGKKYGIKTTAGVDIATLRDQTRELRKAGTSFANQKSIFEDGRIESENGMKSIKLFPLAVALQTELTISYLLQGLSDNIGTMPPISIAAASRDSRVYRNKLILDSVTHSSKPAATCQDYPDSPILLKSHSTPSFLGPTKKETPIDIKRTRDCAFRQLLDDENNMSDDKKWSLLKITEGLSGKEKDAFVTNALEAVTGKNKRTKEQTDSPCYMNSQEMVDKCVKILKMKRTAL
jgi:hypothetical protein